MGDDSTDQAIRDIVSGAGVIYAGLVLEMAVAFLAQVLAARYLSIGDFGGITTGTALLNVGAILGTLGLSEGLTRYLPRADDDEKMTFVWTAFAITIPVSLALGSACTLGAPFIASQIFGDPSITTSLRIFGAGIPFAAVLMLAVGGIRGQEISRYRVYIKNLLQPSVRFGLVIISVIYGLGQTGFALSYTIPYVVAGGVGIVLLRRALPSSLPGRVARNQIGDLWKYSLPMTISKAASFVYRSADIFIILYFIGSDAVGAYGVAYAAARLVLLFNTAFNFLGAPIASRLESEEGEQGMVDAHQPLIRWLVVASTAALLPFLLFPREFISFVYRPRYASGAGALTVLAIGFAVHNVLGAQGNLLRGLGASRVLAINGIVAAVTNVALNLVLVPQYGITGAAVATTVSYLLMDCMMTIELRWKAETSILSSELISPAILAIPVFIVGQYTRNAATGNFLWIFLFCAISASTYLMIVIAVTGFTTADMMLIRSIDEAFDLPTTPIVRLAERFER